MSSKYKLNVLFKVNSHKFSKFFKFKYVSLSSINLVLYIKLSS